jgi:methyl-accepting chemotaxis protein
VKRGAKGVGPIARKAKVPLLASGAALVGVAGAVAATRSGNKRHKVLGVSMPKANGMKPDAKKISEAVVDAAKRADQFGQGVSRVASSVKDMGETANKVAKKT